jgi:hypothetical protein
MPSSPAHKSISLPSQPGHKTFSIPSPPAHNMYRSPSQPGHKKSIILPNQQRHNRDDRYDRTQNVYTAQPTRTQSKRFSFPSQPGHKMFSRGSQCPPGQPDHVKIDKNHFSFLKIKAKIQTVHLHVGILHYWLASDPTT